MRIENKALALDFSSPVGKYIDDETGNPVLLNQATHAIKYSSLFFLMIAIPLHELNILLFLFLKKA